MFINTGDCSHYIHTDCEEIAETIKYLVKDYRINSIFLEIAVPVYREFQARDLETLRVFGNLIKTKYPNQEKSLLMIFVKVEEFEKRIIFAETA